MDPDGGLPLGLGVGVRLNKEVNDSSHLPALLAVLLTIFGLPGRLRLPDLREDEAPWLVFK